MRSELSRATIYAHYERARATIQRCSKEGDLWRAGNGDFTDWYCQTNGRQKLWNLTATEDFQALTSKHRTLYWTLSLFDSGLRGKSRQRPTKDEQGPVLGDYEDIRGYSLGIDIDMKSGHCVTQAEPRKALELSAQYVVDYLHQYCPRSTWPYFSGNGCYVILHHNLLQLGGPPESYVDSLESWYGFGFFVLLYSFNDLIKHIEAQLYSDHPEVKRFVKLDALNNRKRVFKTVFSIHRKLPFCCVPLWRDEVKIDLEGARIPLREDIFDADDWYMSWDASERRKLGEHIRELGFTIQHEVEWQRKQGGGMRESDIRILDRVRIENFPPCIANIAKGRNKNGDAIVAGRTRCKGLLSSYLGQAGWAEREASELWHSVAQVLGGPNTNIFQSTFRKLNVPYCEKIQRKGSGYPRLEVGEVQICDPDDICGTIVSPVQYPIRKKIPIAEVLKWL